MRKNDGREMAVGGIFKGGTSGKTRSACFESALKAQPREIVTASHTGESQGLITRISFLCARWTVLLIRGADNHYVPSAEWMRPEAKISNEMIHIFQGHMQT
jgi:hypothetical protein